EQLVDVHRAGRRRRPGTRGGGAGRRRRRGGDLVRVELDDLHLAEDFPEAHAVPSLVVRTSAVIRTMTGRAYSLSKPTGRRLGATPRRRRGGPSAAAAAGCRRRSARR